MVALLAGLADGFSAAPRGPTASALSRAACAACASVRAPGHAPVLARGAALPQRARLRRSVTKHGPAAPGAADGAAGPGPGREPVDGDSAHCRSASSMPQGGHEYVSILRSAVQRGCNVSLMGRVYGNYKKRKLYVVCDCDELRATVPSRVLCPCALHGE